LDESERNIGNKRNGKGKKTIKSGFGTFDIDTPQDRQSSFEPELVKKRQTILADMNWSSTFFSNSDCSSFLMILSE